MDDVLGDPHDPLRTILDHIPDYVLLVDAAGTIRYLNRAAGGRPTSEVEGRTIFEFAPAEFQPSLHAAFDRVFSTGEPLQFDAPAYGADGLLAWYSCRFLPTRRDGAMAGLMIVATDVTDRKQAEQELQQSKVELEARVAQRTEELEQANRQLRDEIARRTQIEDELREHERFLQHVANAAPFILYVYDLIERRNTFANSQLAEQLGYTPGEVQAMGPDATNHLVYPADLPRVADVFARAAAAPDGEVIADDIRMLRADGEWRWYHCRNVVFTREADGTVRSLLGSAHDVTDFKWISESQRASETRLQQLIAQSPISTQVVAPDGRTLQVNRAWERLWGVTLDQIPDYNILRDTQLDELGVQPLIRQALAGETVTTHAVPYVPDRGPYKDRRRWCSAVIYPVKDDEGQVREIVILHEDVTERKEAQEALSESEARFRAVFHTAAIGIGLAEIEGPRRIIQCNAAMERMWGCEPGGVIGTSLLERTHPDDLAESARLYRELQEGLRDSFQLEKRYRHNAGHYVWGRATVSLLRDAAGTPRYTVGIVEDISQRKQAEEALRQSENRLRLIADSLPVLIAYIDAEQRYRFNNAAYAEWFGPESADLTGRTVREVLGEAYPLFQDSIAAALRGEPISAERSMRLPDGRQRWVHATWVPDIDDRGRVQGYCLLASDVTERKQHEQSLRRAERLAAVGTLAAGIAHEINNPLGALLMSAGVALTSSRQPGREERLRECLELIQSEGQRISRIVRSVQQFAKAGFLTQEPHDLHDVAVRATERLADAAAARGITFDIYQPDDLPPVRLNVVEMEQVFINLLSNAMQASADGATVDIVLAQRPEGVEVRIVDHGRGIPDEILGRVFDPFFTTRENEGGTGLGLSIVHGIIQHHGGTIDLESEVGHGTTVTFRLPLDQGG